MTGPHRKKSSGELAEEAIRRSREDGIVAGIVRRWPESRKRAEEAIRRAKERFSRWEE